MLFDLITIAKVVTIFEYPNKILLFIENLCFCSLKIAVCVPKISVRKKKIKIPSRLKITAQSKNFGLKISGVLDSGIRLPAGFRTTTTSTHHRRHLWNTGHQRGNGSEAKRGKFAYIIGMIAGNEKKYKKS